MTVFGGVLVLLLIAPPGQQTPAPPLPPSSTPAASPSGESAAPSESARHGTDENAGQGQALDGSDDLPVSLKRIKRALASPTPLKVLEPKEIRDGKPVFRVEVEGQKIDIETILGKEFWRGPVAYGGMTHQEFLDLVTPNDVKGYAAFSNAEGITVAATSIALQWAVLKAMDQLKKAKDERAKAQARKEVEDALEALRKARRAAGLPDK
jgi:hypothetical protein